MQRVTTLDRDREAKYLLISDVHWDNPHTNLKLLANHLNEAKRIGAKVLVNGDFFCLMQGRGDPRRSKKDIRPEHNKGNYIDTVIHTAVEWFAPYADTLVWIGYGNHELSIIKHQETDPLRRFADLFNATHKPQQMIRLGVMAGAISLRWADVHKKNYSTVVIKYHHGYGGGGVVTKGVIDNNRQLASSEGYDVIWLGHVHELHHHCDVKEVFNRHTNTLEYKDMHIIRTSTYKDESSEGVGYHIERGRPPKPLGGYWLKIGYKDKQTVIRFEQCTGFY